MVSGSKRIFLIRKTYRDTTKQDLGISIEIILGVQYILDVDCRGDNTLLAKKDICDIMMSYLGTFYWGLRREELLLIHLGATPKVWFHVFLQKNTAHHDSFDWYSYENVLIGYIFHSLCPGNTRWWKSQEMT